MAFYNKFCTFTYIFFPGTPKPQELMFQLEVFPNGEEGEDNCDYVAVFLTSRKQGDLDVKYDFSVLKSDGTCWGRIGNN